jgi:hypothetical protein
MVPSDKEQVLIAHIEEEEKTLYRKPLPLRRFLPNASTQKPEQLIRSHDKLVVERKLRDKNFGRKGSTLPSTFQEPLS